MGELYEVTDVAGINDLFVFSNIGKEPDFSKMVASGMVGVWLCVL